MRIFYILLSVLSPFLLFSQTNSFVFKSYNVDNGLSDNYVEQVFEDSRGFVWMATHNGLNRFDGHSFKTLELKTGDPVLRNFVTSLAEDANHILWIGTLSGVFLYDLNQDTIYHFQNDPSKRDMFSSMYVEDIVFDGRGNTWIATRIGLTKIDKKGDISKFVADYNNPRALPGPYISSLCADHWGTIWIATYDYGLCKVDKDGKSIIRLYNKDDGIPSVSIRDIFEDKDKNLWVAAAKGGLYCKKNGSSKFEKVIVKNQTGNKECNSVFSCVSEDDEGNLWFGTSIDGLIIFNKKTGKAAFYSENTQFPYVISGNSVDDISKDKKGNIWIATHGGGVSVYNPIFNRITYRYKTPHKNALQGNIVSCFYEDKKGNIWIGTDGSGFSCYNPSKNEFKNFSNVNGLSSNAVLDICEIKENTFAIATWNGGLNIFNTSNNQFKQILFDSHKSDKNTQNIYGLYFDKKTELLWCNTYNDGIQIFDCNRLKFLTEQERMKIYPRWDLINLSSKIVFDKKGNSWIGGGYEFVRITKNKPFKYLKADSLKKGVNISTCFDIIEDKSGNIWVAAYGLKKYDSKNDCFIEYPFNDKEIKDAFALVEDRHGNIWVTTSKGILKFNPQTKTFINMTNIWGMPDMQYFRKSAFRSRDGHLYFGGLKGFIVLHEDSNYRYNIVPRLCITKLFLRDEEQYPGLDGSPIVKDILTYKTLTLNHDQTFITLEYAALDYIDNGKIKFRYKLEGFDKEWVNAGSNRRISYTNIPAGTYVFKLVSTNSNGEWSTKPYQMTIIILPPWWNTLWARTLFLIILISAIVAIILYRERRIKFEKNKLEALVALKTSELKESNLTLSEQNITIQENYENLREKQLIIEIKNNQLQEALNIKDKLMTVIAHDFRNPLTTMQGFAKMLSEKIKSRGLTDLEQNVDAITMSADTLQTQMNELLEWSVSKDNAANYKPKDVDLTILLNDVLSLVFETTTHKKITINTAFALNSAAFVDSRMVSTIFRNLIINSVKFTPIGGNISVDVSETDEWIETVIKDSGIGMSQEQIEELVSEKNLLTSDYRSGFGIQICRTFIKRNNGLLHINSELGKGSVFTVLLPKGQFLQKSGKIKPEFKSESLSDYTFPDDNKSILIIDDNKELINYLNEVFAEYFTVYEAFNGREGLKIAQDIVPDIILSDINMPLLDGKELCQQLKNNSVTSHIPILLISGKSLPQEQIDGLLKGADDYIVKPFNISILKQKVFTTIKNRELLASRYSNKKNPTGDFKLPESVEDKLIDEITKKIIDNITNTEFDVEMLAKEVSMSRSQLYRKTKAVLGLSPIDYINTLKFQKSIEMLKTGKYRISEIAYELGFSDARYFSSSFAKRFGVPPSSFISHEKREAGYIDDEQ